MTTKIANSSEDIFSCRPQKLGCGEVYLGIDQGSSSTKAVLLSLARVDLGLTVNSGGTSSNTHGLSSVLDELVVTAPEVYYEVPKAEQDAEGILETVIKALEWGAQLASALGIKIRAVGLACQRSGVLAWDKESGQPLTKMISWADTRFQSEVNALNMVAPRIHQLSGLAPLPNFAAPKISYLQRVFPGRRAYVGTLDSFILFRLSGKDKRFITDHTMASRTLLFDLQKGNWSNELCEIFQVDRKRLPKIVPSLGQHIWASLIDGEKVPITALMGDQQAAILGRYVNSGWSCGVDGADEKQHQALLNLGTIASLSVNLGKGVGVGRKLKIPSLPQLKTNVLFSQREGRHLKRYNMVEMTSPITGRLLLEPQNRGLCNGIEELQRLCEESRERHPEPVIKPLFGELLQSLATCEGALSHMPDAESLDQITIWPEAELDLIFSQEAQGANTISIGDQCRAVVESVGNILSIMLHVFARAGSFEATFAGKDAPPRLEVAGGAAKLNYLLDYLRLKSGYDFDLTAGQDNGAIGAALAGAWAVSIDID